MKDILSYLAVNHQLVTAWTAIAALFVSLISIVLTVVTIKMQRTHNRKSVLPIGHITVADYVDTIFVKLRNDGVGPMIIDRAVVTNKDGREELAIIDFMPDLPKDYFWRTFVHDISGRALSPDKDLTLISFGGDSTNKGFEQLRNKIRKALSVLSIKVEYKNIYGEEMPPAVRKLDWFARTT